MARVYRLQMNPETFETMRSGKDVVFTEYLMFDNDEEKLEFLDNPEKFMRKVGLYTEKMPFKGLWMREGVSLDTYREDLRRLVWVGHDTNCQGHLPCILCPP